ncbi:MAG: type II secretion system protein [Kiritimatiellae bacterium]|nr:type II secretion system protein [Kiritimatiellia bacterium]
MKKHSASRLLHPACIRQPPEAIADRPAFSSAFSLIELIAVIAIVGVLMMAAIIKFGGADSWNDRIAANEIRSHLAYIRNMAMNHERATRVVFNVAANNYTVWIDTTGTGSFAAAREPVTRQDWIVDLGKRFSGAALDTVDINGGDTLYFSETNGMPFDSGLAPLTADGVITLHSGLMVTVAPVTGYADVIE